MSALSYILSDQVRDERIVLIGGDFNAEFSQAVEEQDQELPHDVLLLPANRRGDCLVTALGQHGLKLHAQDLPLKPTRYSWGHFGDPVHGQSIDWFASNVHHVPCHACVRRDLHSFLNTDHEAIQLNFFFSGAAVSDTHAQFSTRRRPPMGKGCSIVDPSALQAYNAEVTTILATYNQLQASDMRRSELLPAALSDARQAFLK